MKVIMIEHQSGDKDREVGETYSVPNDEALRMIDADIAKPKSKEEYEEILSKLEEKRLEKEEKEQKAAAILHKEELEEKRAHHQSEIDEITHALGDGAIYYKSYADLAADLEKKDDLPQGPGDE